MLGYCSLARYSHSNIRSQRIDHAGILMPHVVVFYPALSTAVFMMISLIGEELLSAVQAVLFSFGPHVLTEFKIVI